MPSFDVISKINYQEFDNALANCLREISNRYDFKGLHITIERKDKSITTNASDELKEFVKPFGLPFYFHDAYAKFSRG